MSGQGTGGQGAGGQGAGGVPCGCCELPAPLTPLEVENRAGLSAVVYRVGTYTSFRETMLEQIAGATELSRLSTRNDDDYAITLVDLWAATADVLTFYQERYANEAFLRTASQSASVARLARLIDYSLRPGIAALAWLSFTVEVGQTLRVPPGLRVQSVPGQDEKPQTFETLGEITADARLNDLRAMPAPYGLNPVAAGAVQALLAPGDAPLSAISALAAGDTVVLYRAGAAGAIESLLITAVTVLEDRVTLQWQAPVQGIWSSSTPLRKTGRRFRLFGHTAPDSSMTAVADSRVPGGIGWSIHATNFGVPAGSSLALDARVDGIATGAQLLVDDAGGPTSVVTVTGARTAGQALAGLTDTVTILSVTPALPATADRRDVTVYELLGDDIPLWGCAYPARLAGGSLFLPGRWFADGTIEVGRTIARGAYQPGVKLAPGDVAPGRTLLVGDAQSDPVPATVASAALCGPTVDVRRTAADATSAAELGLDTASATALEGLLGAALPAGLTLTATVPQLRVQIGELPIRTVTLPGSITTPPSAAAALSAALMTAGPEPQWAATIVLALDDRLLACAGGIAIRLMPAASDETTVRELGLDSDQAGLVGGLLSQPIVAPVALSAPAPQVSVTIGPIGPRTVPVGDASTIASLAHSLEQAIAAADPAPGFGSVRVLISGERLLMLPGPVGEDIAAYLRIEVDSEQPLDLDATSAYLLGNVAAASHGQTVASEVLGDGDAGASFQRLALSKQPLTYLPSPTLEGVQSTLGLRVGGVLWQGVDGLYDQRPDAQVYTARNEPDGSTVLEFGDGRTGATLPTGRGNVTATYRVGAGLAGRVGARTLTTPLDRPTGLRGVTNPLAARGGADPQTLEDARQNAPATVRTFGRAVSLLDFGDLIRASGEVAKTQTTWVWDGFDRAVHVTVAGQAGGLFTDDDLRQIGASLAGAREPDYRVLLANFVPLPILFGATVEIDPRYVQQDVLDAVRASVLAALSFDALSLGTPVRLSEVYRVIQDVDGVLASDIDELQAKRPADRDRPNVDRLTDGSPAPRQTRLPVLPARPDALHPGTVLPAELATVEDVARDVRLAATGGLDP